MALHVAPLSRPLARAARQVLLDAGAATAPVWGAGTPLHYATRSGSTDAMSAERTMRAAGAAEGRRASPQYAVSGLWGGEPGGTTSTAA